MKTIKIISLILLITPQTYAFAKQFQLGFVPFVQAPRRVHFSWDMFATPVERCHVIYQSGNTTIAPMIIANLEWDVVFDTVRDYELFFKHLCLNGHTGVQQMHLTCFRKNGTITHETFDCQ